MGQSEEALPQLKSRFRTAVSLIFSTSGLRRSPSEMLSRVVNMNGSLNRDCCNAIVVFSTFKGQMAPCFCQVMPGYCMNSF